MKTTVVEEAMRLAELFKIAGSPDLSHEETQEMDNISSSLFGFVLVTSYMRLYEEDRKNFFKLVFEPVVERLRAAVSEEIKGLEETLRGLSPANA